MSMSTKVRATLFAGALAVTCGVVLASRGSDWFRPSSKAERNKSHARDKTLWSSFDNRQQSNSMNDTAGDAGEDRFDQSSIDEPKGCDFCPEGRFRGLLELCSIFDAPLVEEMSIATRMPPTPRTQEAPPKPVDPMAVTDGDRLLMEEIIQLSSSSTVEPSVPVHDGSGSTLPTPTAEKRVLNPLAVPFQPRRTLNANAVPFEPGRRRLNPSAAPFSPSQGFN